jgi:hypothetical protein
MLAVAEHEEDSKEFHLVDDHAKPVQLAPAYLTTITDAFGGG